MSATDSSITTARHAARAASEKLAEDIVALDVSERLALADVFLIASAPSERQVNAIVDGIENERSKFDQKPVRREGRPVAAGCCWTTRTWSSTSSTRKTASSTPLERLWKDCPVVDLQLGDDASAKATASTDTE